MIQGTSNFKLNAHLIRLIVANSLVSSYALSCGTEDSAMDMSWISGFGIEGVSANFLKPLYMQLPYFLKPLYMQLTYLLDYVYVLEWAHSLAWLVGWLCIMVFMTCLVCRM